MKSKFKVGQKIKFSWYQGQVLDGQILDVKQTLFGVKYRVLYGVEAFGIKVAESEQWVKEKDIFK